ncbi:MAG: response regulator [Candidatus Magnetoovum sp. WYHC-5]|nr:response regulator [Candidatus Magnetoovum sp. WYHC-5]
MSAKILVVEDEWIIAANLKSTLEELGYAVVAIVTTGEAAVESARLQTPDLVLMDITLKGSMDGIEAATKIYNELNIPIIYVTSHVDERVIKRAKTSKPFAYLIKPYEKASLISSIEMALYNHRIDKELQEKTLQLEELNRNLEHRVKEEVEKGRQQEYMLIHQSKLASMGEMIGAIAHQWRQPLNIIGLLIQDLEEAYQFGEMDSEYLKKMVNEAMANLNNMSNTIAEFRNFFKPKHEKTTFNVIKSVEKVLALLRTQFENYNIQINVAYPSCNQFNNSISIFGYVDEFQQVVLNVLNNAKDSILTKRGKHATNEKGEIELSLLLVKDKILLIIKDNGTGVPEEIKDRIFEPYFSTKQEGDGTGIGLYMSKMIIENHMGGKMYVENNGNGATFTVELKKDR